MLPPLWLSVGFIERGLCYGVNFYIRISVPKRFQAYKYIVLEHGAGEICLCVFHAVKSVKNLHICVTDKQIFR